METTGVFRVRVLRDLGSDGAAAAIPARVWLRLRRQHGIRLKLRPTTREKLLSDNITLTGIVASEPRSITTSEGLAITSFRLASSQRRFDRGQQKWIDADTNWYSITMFRQLATNCAVSIHKTDRVVVTGRLRVKDWTTGDKSGTNIEVDADAIGHDLSWGTAAFSRNAVSARTDAPLPSDAAGFPSEAVHADAVPTHEGQNGSGDAPELVGALSAGGTEIETPF
jgi:single-strand DNA-binding protein